MTTQDQPVMTPARRAALDQLTNAAIGDVLALTAEQQQDLEDRAEAWLTGLIDELGVGATVNMLGGLLTAGVDHAVAETADTIRRLEEHR